MAYTIVNHILHKDGVMVRQRSTPNRGGFIRPSILVMHFTGADNADGSINWLCDPLSKVSAHLVLDQKGNVTQLAPFNRACWHAGKSKWGSVTNMNSNSIGIEMANCGPLKKIADGTYRAEMGKKILKTFQPSEVVVAAHKNSPGNVIGWDDYPAEQVNASIEIIAAIVAKYGIKENNVVGHDDIAPIRKVDPGPAYPLARVKSAAFGRK